MPLYLAFMGFSTYSIRENMAHYTILFQFVQLLCAKATDLFNI